MCTDNLNTEDLDGYALKNLLASWMLACLWELGLRDSFHHSLILKILTISELCKLYGLFVIPLGG